MKKKSGHIHRLHKTHADPIIRQTDDFELKGEYDFSKGVRGRFYRPKKISTSMRLDNDILLYLKKITGEKKIGYQTLINNILREFIKKVKIK